MIIKIRTKDDLVDLLKKGISFSWKISQWRLDHIIEVHIYDFSGKAKIKGDFDKGNTQLLENGRIAIAFNNAVIEAADYSWIGQNPIKFESDNNESELSYEEKNENKNMNSQSNFPDGKYESLEWDKAIDLAQRINSSVYQRVSNFFDSKEHDNFIAQRIDENSIRIISKHPKADETTNYYFDLTSTGLEFYFSNQNTGIYVDILNEFDDFESYFDVNYDYGSAIAEILHNKYKEVFESRIESGDDLELDEDFKMYFIDNFVNYILNDVYIEE
jgi:hypothetical protein